MNIPCMTPFWTPFERTLNSSPAPDSSHQYASSQPISCQHVSQQPSFQPCFPVLQQPPSPELQQPLFSVLQQPPVAHTAAPVPVPRACAAAPLPCAVVPVPRARVPVLVPAPMTHAAIIPHSHPGFSRPCCCSVSLQCHWSHRFTCLLICCPTSPSPTGSPSPSFFCPCAPAQTPRARAALRPLTAVLLQSWHLLLHH